MPSHVSFIQKLWDKGVDISASVITSVIIALIGLLFWRFKLWLDLHAKAEEKRQHDRMEDERSEIEKKRLAIERHTTMKRELEEIMFAAEGVSNAGSEGEVWEIYMRFVRRYALDEIPGNIENSPQRSYIEGALRPGRTFADIEPQAKQEMVKLIRSTVLQPAPKDGESSHPGLS